MNVVDRIELIGQIKKINKTIVKYINNHCVMCAAVEWAREKKLSVSFIICLGDYYHYKNK